jgi:hypothetical protein
MGRGLSWTFGSTDARLPGVSPKVAVGAGSGRNLAVDVKLQELLEGVEATLPNKHYRTLRAVFESYSYIAELVSDENMTMDRLRERLWGGEHQADEGPSGRRKKFANATGRRARPRRRAARSIKSRSSR